MACRACRVCTGQFTAELAVQWTRQSWEADWKPKLESPTQKAPAMKKRKTAGKPVVTAASFLADSDDEDAMEEPFQAGVQVEGQEKEDELTRYLGFSRVAPHVDILAWWKENEKQLPYLAAMAREFLAVPASTAGVERAFSSVGHMHGDLRKCTGEDTIKHSLMAAMNT